MKKVLLFWVMLLLAGSMYAQSAAEDVKGFQWGVSARAEFVNWVHSQISANLSLGYRFDRRNYVGVRTGYAFKGKTYVDADPGTYYYRGIPAIAEYTHYFPVGRTKMHSIFLGAEGGCTFAHYYNGFGCTWEETEGATQRRQVYNTTPVTKVIPFAGVKSGLDFNIADFTHLQFGIIVSYWGYGVMAGLTF